MVSRLYANIISQGLLVALRLQVPEPVSQQFLSFIIKTQLKAINEVNATGHDELLQV